MISSCTKSITSLLACIALGQGLFDLDDKIVDHFPDATSTWGQQPPILVRHVLSMSTGSAETDPAMLLETTDVVGLVLGSARSAEPGSKFEYDNGLPCLIGFLIERTSELPLHQFAEKYLFGPMGVEDYTWTIVQRQTRIPLTDAAAMCSGGMYLSLDSWLKIGRMLLQQGQFGGREIVRKSALEMATKQYTAPLQETIPTACFFI